MKMNKEYWENRYEEASLGWDIGYVSTPLKEYVDQLENNDLRILIPGAGYGYEAIYLYEQGFKNVYVLDIASRPLQRIKDSCPDFPEEQLVEADFFEVDLEPFDLILEQTFFCALDPQMRSMYAERMYELLREGGKLAGLFFDFPLTEQGPPFGGSREEYEQLFSKYFKIHTLERSRNSIPPRMGNELFFIFEK